MYDTAKMRRFGDHVVQLATHSGGAAPAFSDCHQEAPTNPAEKVVRGCHQSSVTAAEKDSVKHYRVRTPHSVPCEHSLRFGAKILNYVLMRVMSGTWESSKRISAQNVLETTECQSNTPPHISPEPIYYSVFYYAATNPPILVASSKGDSFLRIVETSSESSISCDTRNRSQKFSSARVSKFLRSCFLLMHHVNSLGTQWLHHLTNISRQYSQSRELADAGMQLLGSLLR